MAENEKVSLQAQAPKVPTSKQPITIVEDAFEEQVRTSKKTRKAQPTALFQECTHNGNGTMFKVEKNSKTRNQRTAEPDAMDQNDINSDDDEEDTSEMSATSNKKGMSLDMYFKVHGINLEDEEDEEDEENELDDNANDAGSGGQTSNEDFNDRREVEFFQGQPVGPTNEVVSDLNQLLGTTVKNPRFVTLLYTSWHGVPSKLKEEMWDYANQKFILPISSKPWVMRRFCGAWKKYKREIKKEHFVKYKTKKEMIKNRPLEIPEVQFRKLIRYWSLPAIKAISAKNTENRLKQTCPHRMGSTNFGIVRKQLRDSKENSEEPSRAEVFIATRTSKKGKEIDAKTQATITELQNHLEAGENEEDTFVGVLGKDQPGRLRCYGASITRSSLKKDEEIRHIKVEYNTKVSSLEKKMDGVCGLLMILVHQLNPGMSNEEVTALVQAAQDSPVDTSSSKAKNTPRSSEATHIPYKDDVGKIVA
ncbi:uncharacterized protein LOC130934218 [Arachis stenosperma]|uniref:uncharacterized protein LOC130934218 n=1 Tax=Arachis stenosperma TaxID=217475 RepID=UPI0025ACBCBB|nr:uncharacterized protein LOC130934218 [Arachis stenosperma]